VVSIWRWCRGHLYNVVQTEHLEGFGQLEARIAVGFEEEKKAGCCGYRGLMAEDRRCLRIMDEDVRARDIVVGFRERRFGVDAKGGRVIVAEQ